MLLRLLPCYLQEKLEEFRDENCPSVIPCYFEQFFAKTEEITLKDNESWYASQVLIKFEHSPSVVEHVKESISYDLQSLISEVGGNLGLTLGLSGMSMIGLVTKIFKKH